MAVGLNHVLQPDDGRVVDGSQNLDLVHRDVALAARQRHLPLADDLDGHRAARGPRVGVKRESDQAASSGAELPRHDVLLAELGRIFLHEAASIKLLEAKQNIN